MSIGSSYNKVMWESMGYALFATTPKDIPV